ncbi:MAG: hypothetical protein ACC682_16060, partial [Gemmatimonadota bacterium]
MSNTKLSLQPAIAAFGVVLSLVFVGYEIRQNTQVARGAAVQATMDQILQWQAESGTDPEWIRILDFLRNGGSYSELAQIDQTKFNWVVSSTVRITENRFRQMQMGVIDDGDLGIGGGTSNAAWFRSTYFLEWWASADRTQSWAPDFLEFFETEVL